MQTHQNECEAELGCTWLQEIEDVVGTGQEVHGARAQKMGRVQREGERVCEANKPTQPGLHHNANTCSGRELSGVKRAR